MLKPFQKIWGTNNVRVNVINPGPTETSLWENLVSKISGQLNISKQKFMDEVVSSNPLSRIALPNDIANTVAFLCSDGARFVNGAFVTVDGGATYSF